MVLNGLETKRKEKGFSVRTTLVNPSDPNDEVVIIGSKIFGTMDEVYEHLKEAEKANDDKIIDRDIIVEEVEYEVQEVVLLNKRVTSEKIVKVVQGDPKYFELGIEVRNKRAKEKAEDNNWKEEFLKRIITVFSDKF